MQFRTTLRWTLLAMTLACLATQSGCRREFYRRQADNESLAAIEQYSRGPNWVLQDYRLYPGQASRMFDPFNPDRPAMPPDDPAAHRLMHYVDGKRGYKHWGRNGLAPGVDMEIWRQYLPVNEEGRLVLDMEGAVQLAFLHSRDYQREMEDLYLSALDVTFERFRFDAQFFAGNNTFFTALGRDRGGGNSSSQLRTDTEFGFNKLFPAGGELAVGFANSFIWEFSGTDRETATSLLDFTFVQPLLRFGGRARVMEQLTQSERNLLANVRQMEQFRRGYYTLIVAGINPGAGPVRGGIGFDATVPGLNAGGNAGGFLALLQDRQEIRNQEANVAALRLSRNQLQEHFEAGRMRDRLQVDQATQALYNGQSRLLSLKTGYETRLDDYKVTLGMPPELETEVDDPLLLRFNFLTEDVTRLQEQVEAVLNRARDETQPIDLAQLHQLIDELLALQEPAVEQLAVLEADVQQLTTNLPQRLAQLGTLSQRPEVIRGDVDPEAYSREGLQLRYKLLEERLHSLRADLDRNWQAHRQFQETAGTLQLEEARKQFVAQADLLSGYLVELALLQARARLDAVLLVPVALDWRSAVAIARENRYDWMNSRAALVDAWRQIEFEANALRSVLNIVVEGDLGTTDDDPFRFRDTNGRLRLGAEFDAPLTRVVERNIYRETLIEYQRARREYMLVEDVITQSLRNVLRVMELNQLDFELRRAAVFVAIDQYDLAREKLYEPPKAGEASQFGATTARDLVSALADLLNAQNDFLTAWVNYESLRLNLDFELGTMQLGPDGMWVDPGPIGAVSGEEVPPPAADEQELPPPPLGNELLLPEIPLLLPQGESGDGGAARPVAVELTQQQTWMQLKPIEAPSGEN